jgi:hypothetical protein
MTLGAILVLIALAQSAAYLVTAGPSPPDGIGSLIAAYDSVERLLPPDGVVGFAETSADVEFNTITYYVAQQALAPRVLSREAAADAEFVVSTPGAPADAGKLPALAGCRLVGTGVGDVRVFRRGPP